MRLRPGVFLTALACVALTAGPAASATERQILFWAPNAAGTPEQAAAAMADFAGYIAAAAGWPEGSAGAEYRNTVEGGLEAQAAARPAFVVVPMPLWLRHGEERGWRPLRVLVTDAADRQRYTVYGPPGSSLQALRGAPLVGEVAYDAAFVAGVVLGRPDERLPFETQPTSRTLSAVRRALRGEPVAVLLDEGQRAALASLPGGDGLALLAESPWMPAGIFCADAAAEEDAAAVGRVLDGAADDPAAAEILGTMQIRRFEPVPGEALASVGRAYRAARSAASQGGGTGR